MSIEREAVLEVPLFARYSSTIVILVDEVLAMAEQTKGSHFGEEDEGEMGTCSKEGIHSTAVFTFD